MAVCSAHSCSSAVAIAPDGSWLATAGDGTVRIWDPVTGTQRHALTGHTDTVWAAAIAPDGSSLTIAGGTTQINKNITAQRVLGLPRP